MPTHIAVDPPQGRARAPRQSHQTMMHLRLVALGPALAGPPLELRFVPVPGFWTTDTVSLCRLSMPLSKLKNLRHESQTSAFCVYSRLPCYVRTITLYIS